MSSKKQDEELEINQEDEILDEVEDGAQEEANEISEDESLEAKVEALEEELKALNDKYLRANAEFENMRKRFEKEKFQAISYAHEQFARDLLPIIDALENAITTVLDSKDAQSQESMAKYKEGIELTIEQFRKCFDKHGIKQASSEGEFDPNIHEAIMKVESDEVESGHIVQTLQKGYTIKERVLRPAMVSIAK